MHHGNYDVTQFDGMRGVKFEKVGGIPHLTFMFRNKRAVSFPVSSSDVDDIYTACEDYYAWQSAIYRGGTNG